MGDVPVALTAAGGGGVMYNVLLYGATGYSGRLIAAEAKKRGLSRGDVGNVRMILAARDGTALHQIAEKYGMDFRVFALDERDEIVRRLDGVDLVLNAAGPFAFTAERLLKAALTQGCHYADINGEIDVYRKLDDFGRNARQRGCVIVSAAGDTAAASDMLLDQALTDLAKARRDERNKPRTIRLGFSRVTDLSRGSIETAARLLREQVTTVRKGYTVNHQGRPISGLVTWHEPVGKLEHAFDFDDRAKKERGSRRVASAANLIDTLAARATTLRHRMPVHAIESYIEMTTAGRASYQLLGMFAPLALLPFLRGLVKAQIAMLPEGPRPQDVGQARHTIVLEIENAYRELLIDWRLETPDVYQFTAQLAVAVACRLAGAPGLTGFLTPTVVLGSLKKALADGDMALRGCQLQEGRV